MIIDERLNDIKDGKPLSEVFADLTTFDGILGIQGRD